MVDYIRIIEYTYKAMRSAAAIEVGPVVRLFKALGDESRLRIVALLTHGELCVCHLQDALGLSQPNVSRHLGVLRFAGVVEDRRQGNWVYYRLKKQTDPICRRHFQALIGSFAERGVLRRDLERLIRVRGPEACP